MRFTTGQRCKKCGCTDDDCSVCVEKTGRACVWTADDLCSACVEPHEYTPVTIPLIAYYTGTAGTQTQCATCLHPSVPEPGDPVCLVSQG